MIGRHEGHWSTFPPRNLFVLVVAWIVTASLLGVIITRFKNLRPWPFVALATVVGSFLVLRAMLAIAPSTPKFATTDQMMTYMAHQAARWVKKDRGIDMDYSVDSIKLIEEELARISEEVDKANPQRGTFGLALGYGAYVGEVFRRQNGGSWAADSPVGGEGSYPLVMSNSTIFPVGWCWKRLTQGESDNVYHKAMILSKAHSIKETAENQAAEIEAASPEEGDATNKVE